jgi:hypothetical protein
MSLSPSLNGAAIAETTIPAASIPGCCIYARLAFTPIVHSAGRTYFISLSSDGFTPPNGVTVFLSGRDVYKDGKFFVDERDSGQDTSFRTFYLPSATCFTCQR